MGLRCVFESKVEMYYTRLVASALWQSVIAARDGFELVQVGIRWPLWANC
jgi:hypothetical protein